MDYQLFYNMNNIGSNSFKKSKIVINIILVFFIIFEGRMSTNTVFRLKRMERVCLLKVTRH